MENFKIKNKFFLREAGGDDKLNFFFYGALLVWGCQDKAS
jgi:hypothetical protein